MNYGFKKIANLRSDSDYSVRCIFPDARHAEEYRNWEANKSPAMRKLFNIQERLVLYLKFTYKLGRKRIRNATGIAENKVRRILYKAYTIARYESQSFAKPQSSLDFNFTSKKQ